MLMVLTLSHLRTSFLASAHVAWLDDKAGGRVLAQRVRKTPRDPAYAYTLTLASLLMLSGSIGDRFGRRREEPG